MKNNKTNKNQFGKFKTHTDIHNYNKFLLDLDNKLVKQTIIDASLNKINNNEKTSMNKLITNINTKAVNESIMSPNISGLTPWEMLLVELEKEVYQPNLYVQENPILLVNPLSVTTELDKDIDIDIDIDTHAKKEYLKQKEKVFIQADINNIQDLLDLIEKYPNHPKFEYNINMKALHKIKEPLNELNNMIGIKELKENIVDQILFYIQNLHTLNAKSISGNDFMHTVIYGPPGTGKTEVAKIIGAIFAKLGILKKGTFKKATRADLIAGYLGQTALKTRDVINECLGGVLFIDEAYALGNEEKRDSFSKECIDTLCEALSDNKDNLMVIIAGYEADLNECFFNYNQGLNSRFTWRFKTDDYTSEDLYKIFVKKVKDANWKLDVSTNINVKWFEKNKKHFKFYGRDIETLLAKTKIAHSRRVFCLDQEAKKNIILKDLDKGLEIYLKNFNTKKKEDEERLRNIVTSMYM
uniref:AAA+ ATPase domain-containing protein n=1 Tax=viral metagenome TaxID=1070528 RepID=A0A6C0IUE4_9ZZZZ